MLISCEVTTKNQLKETPCKNKITRKNNPRQTTFISLLLAG